MLNVITGDGTTGAAPVDHKDVDKIGFTGSTATGKAIVRAASGNLKRVSLELGGKSPVFIFPDADLDRAISGAAEAVMLNSGQACTAGSRLYVQEDVYDRVIKGVADYIEGLKLGHDLDAESNLGPLISQKQSTGLGFGAAAVLASAIYNIGVAEGRAAGFSVGDLTLLRYLGATLALAPVALARMGRAGTRPKAWQILALLGLAGPHFGILYNFGMPLTKLSHAVIISPGMSMLVAVLLTAMSVRQVPTAARLIGMALLLVALSLIALDLGSSDGPAQMWRGDLIFVLTGTLYGVFSFLLGRWKADAVAITLWILAVSLLMVGPWYLAVATPTTHPPSACALQFVVQGVLGGGWAIVLYALSIRHLGAGRAGIFPALVPGAAAVLSIPISGVLPSGLEGLGCLLAAIGMLLTLRNSKRPPN